MKTDDLGNLFFSSTDLLNEIYQGNIDKLHLAKVDHNDTDYQKYIQFVTQNELNEWPLPEPFILTNEDMIAFDKKNQNQWFMPKEYMDFNIIDHLYSLCKTDKEVDRVSEELELFAKHDMIELLKFLKYLVDIMKQNNILWGVGRGSSVASYCLYLLNVHKIDSIKYNLDIREFLK
jgi:DNA polymerase III alpha subunit